MTQQLVHVALLVHDYDEALAFYTEKLGFQLLTDTPLDPGKRWVLVAPARLCCWPRPRGPSSKAG